MNIHDEIAAQQAARLASIATEPDPVERARTRMLIYYNRMVLDLSVTPEELADFRVAMQQPIVDWESWGDA